MKKIILFTLFWFVLSLLQAIFTEIIDDEAYYWVYAQFLDWGFFDHPPMIALLIRLGSLVFPGELGVRLLPSLLGAGTIFLVCTLLNDQMKNIWLLMLIILSIPLYHAHVAGFIATPDLPLVFFSCLFFLLYRNYLERDSVANTVFWSLSIVLVLYSKYHGFLILGFTILSNLKIVLKRSFWMAAVISLILYLPHIIWQIRHDFVSFGYHLIDRSNPLQISYLLIYLRDQLLLLGPLTGTLLLYLAISRKSANKFDTALKVNLVGFFLFFLITSLKGRVEPHWTAAALVPLVLLAAPMVEKRQILRRVFLILGLITLPAIILLRLSVITEFSLMPENLVQRFHNKQAYYMQIEQEADGRPVVFTNSYQEASLYRYFTRQPAFSQNNKYYRRNQYDLLDLEAEFHGTEVLLIPHTVFPGCDTLKTIRGDLVVYHTECYCHFNRVEIGLPEMEWDFLAGEEVQINLVLHNPTADSIRFRDACTHKPWLVYSYFSKGEEHLAFLVSSPHPIPDLAPGESVPFPVGITLPEKPGSYQLLFSFGSEHQPAGINGRPVKISVHSRSRANSG